MKINKKKIACLALASALVIPGVMGLVGCEKNHTHAFNSDPFYEVITENETKIARSWRECSCGAEDAHKKVDNAVIVNPDNVTTILSESISNKTIIFDDGIYSTSLNFISTINNVTLAGTENSEFKHNLKFEGKTSSINNLTLYRLKFSGIYGMLLFSNANLIKDLTVASCSFITEENDGKYAAVRFGGMENIKPINITLRNSIIDGHYQGFQGSNITNVTIENNTIKNTSHNAIAIQSFGSSNYNTDYYSTGDIVIKNNTIDNTQNRAIRFGVVQDATIEVSGNIFSSVKAEDDGTIEILKAQILGCNAFRFVNNSYSGNAMNNITSVPQNPTDFVVSV